MIFYEIKLNLLKLLGSMNSEQPNCSANLRLSGFISIPITVLAPDCLQANAVDSPIAPKPQTAQVEPGWTWASFWAVPKPVPTAQPMIQAFFKFNLGLTSNQIRLIIVIMNWKSGNSFELGTIYFKTKNKSKFNKIDLNLLYIFAKLSEHYILSKYWSHIKSKEVFH